MNKNLKITSYLKYSVGEIVLVVLGILVAIQINNWNEKRKDIATVQKIFVELQSELLSDIEETNRLIRFSEYVDEKIEEVLDSEVVEADYSDPSKSYLFKLGTNTYPLVVTNLAFNKLSKFQGYIPEDYRALMEDMNGLYIEEKMYMDELFTRLNDYTLKYYNNMFAKHEWMVEYENAEITDAMVYYFLSDPFYKNHLKRYKDLLYVLGQGNARRFRSTACILYYDIEEITKTGMFPKIIEDFKPAEDTLVFTEFTGNYENVDSEEVLSISNKKGRLYANNTVIIKDGIDTFKYDQFAKNYIYFVRNEKDEIIESNIMWEDSLFVNIKVQESYSLVDSLSNTETQK